MEIKIVLGSLFGDEGKGNTVQWLCKEAIKEGKKPCVVRYSGGPQSGHTVVNNGVTHVCSSFGSGVLLGVPTLYTEYAYIDPLCVENEIKELEKKGIKNPKLYIEDYVGVITPYDVLNQQLYANKNPFETCGKGLMSTVIRENKCVVFPFASKEDNEEFLEYLEDVKSYYSDLNDTEPEVEVLNNWNKAFDNIYSLYKNEKDDPSNYNLLEKLQTEFDVFIFEGTQGLLLDIENGYYPYVTSTKVGLNGIPEEYLKDAEVYLVSRSYVTRHGKMSPEDEEYFTRNKITIPSSKLETNITNEFQGEFKTALFKISFFEQAIQRNRLDSYQIKYNMKFNLCITHMDVDSCIYIGGVRITALLGALLTANRLNISKIYTSDNPESNFIKIYG